MRRSPFALLPLLALASLSACSFTVSDRGGVTFRVDELVSDSLEASATEERSFPLELRAGDVLVLEDFDGAVTLVAGDGTPRLDAHLEVRAETGDKARGVLESTEIVTERRDGRLVVRRLGPRLDGPETLYFSPRSAYDVAVPRGVAVDLETATGALDVQGPLSGARLSSRHGRLRCRDVEGAVDLRTVSGSIELAHVRGGDVLADTSYGSIEARDVVADTFTATSSSGRVELEGVTAPAIVARTSYGSIELADLEGEVEARTSSGSVRVADCEGERIFVRTSYGGIDAQRVTGALDAATSSGRVEVSGHAGSVTAESDYGSVTVEGLLAAVRASSASGGVRVTARPGSRVERAWSLSSGYGSVSLALPADAACEIDGRTGRGSVDCELPLTVDERRGEVRGALNGGGARVELRTDSGSIALRLADGR